MQKLKKNVFLAIWASVFAVVLAVTITLNVVAINFKGALELYFGMVGASSPVTDADDNTIYFKSEYKNYTELQPHLYATNEQIVAEGITMVKNKGALPLAKTSKISLLGNSTTDLITSGHGSGDASNKAMTTQLFDAMKNEGFSVNENLSKLYETGSLSKYGNGVGSALDGAKGWDLAEAPKSEYTPAVTGTVNGFQDAAIVVFSRNGSEGGDLPRNMSSTKGGTADKHYLQLTDNERDLLKLAHANFSKVILVINSANTFQLDFIDDAELGIDACLILGFAGFNGATALANIISGDAIPSGHVVDTYAADYLASPAMQNFGDFIYNGATLYYIIEAEGIYVGYRYYETRYEDYVLGKTNVGSFDYDAEVVYPFGYGLSYTNFTWSEFTVSTPDAKGDIKASVKVTNSGVTYSGKDVVQIYVSSPYTAYDITNKVEKSAVDLVGFAKTGILAPGKSETVEVIFNKADMTSFDAYGKKTYILEAGNYYITAATDAHNAVNNILLKKADNGITVDTGKMAGAGNKALVGVYAQAADDFTTYAADRHTGAAITTQLSFADIAHPNSKDAYDANFEYLSRNDWTGTFPTPYGTENATKSDNQNGKYYAADIKAGLKSQIEMIGYAASGNPKAVTDPSYKMPTLEAQTTHELIELRGKPFDDPAWNALLDQLSKADLIKLVSECGYITQSAKSVNKPKTSDKDGPLGFSSIVGGASGSVRAMGWASEVVLASTWNIDLAKEMGKCVGEEALNGGVNGWYAPAMNGHRSPFAGRNFEYYSEDGLGAGKIASAVVAGCQTKGLYPYLKHFAFNDQESHRGGVSMWGNEQAFREIYLAPFYACIVDNKDNGPLAVMTSYNRVGPTWTGGSYNLLTGILRKEWAFNQLIITDYVAGSHMDSDMFLAAGGNGALTNDSSKKPKDVKSNASIYFMRESAHSMMYTVVNSNAMNGIAIGTVLNDGFPVYGIILIIFDSVVAIGIGVGIFFLLRKYKRMEA